MSMLPFIGSALNDLINASLYIFVISSAEEITLLSADVSVSPKTFLLICLVRGWLLKWISVLIFKKIQSQWPKRKEMSSVFELMRFWTLNQLLLKNYLEILFNFFSEYFEDRMARLFKIVAPFCFYTPNIINMYGRMI